MKMRFYARLQRASMGPSAPEGGGRTGRGQEKCPARRLRRAGLKSVNQEDDPQEEPGSSVRVEAACASGTTPIGGSGDKPCLTPVVRHSENSSRSRTRRSCGLNTFM